MRAHCPPVFSVRSRPCPAASPPANGSKTPRGPGGLRSRICADYHAQFLPQLQLLNWQRALTLPAPLPAGRTLQSGETETCEVRGNVARGNVACDGLSPLVACLPACLALGPAPTTPCPAPLPTAAAPPPPPSPLPLSLCLQHHVVHGDNMWKIAHHYGVDLEELIHMNDHVRPCHCRWRCWLWAALPCHALLCSPAVSRGLPAPA